MTLLYFIAAALGTALLGYLLIALLAPEKLS